MATLIAHIKVRPGREAEFEDMARQLAEGTRKEPGCRRYEYYRRAEPGHYLCMESFADFRAFIDHQTSPHHESAPLGALIEQVRVEWIDPLPGASVFPPTDPQPLAAGATETAIAYAGKYPVEIGWWHERR